MSQPTSPNEQPIQFVAPDDGGWHHTVMRDWIAVCPDIGPTAFRLYAITRSLVIEKRGSVRKLTLNELCHLLPGPNGKPSSLGRIRDAIRELSAIGLYSTPDGKAVTTSSSKNAAERPMLIRVNDFPTKPSAYKGPKNAFEVLERVRGHEDEEPGWISNQGSTPGQISNQVGQKSNQSGWDFNREMPVTSGNAAPKEDFEGRLRKEDDGGDGRQAPTGRSGRASSGFAASGKTSSTIEKPKPAELRTVVEGVPEPLKQLLQEDWPRGLPGQVNDLIAAGLLREHRTAAQLLERMARRWQVFGYEDALLSQSGEGIRRSLGVLEELLSPSKCNGNNIDCEDGIELYTGRECPRCAEAREDRIRAAVPAPAPEMKPKAMAHRPAPPPLPAPRDEAGEGTTYGVNVDLARQMREAILANKGRMR